VTYKDERLLVENELLIDGDVSLATGDINFSGNIHIRGNVLTGVVVASAKGDVIVDGYVEACQIYAGGSVVMKNGMQGNGKGKIIAGGSVSGKFFERVTIESGMDVHANAIMNSDITAVQDIVVSGKFWYYHWRMHKNAASGYGNDHWQYVRSKNHFAGRKVMLICMQLC